MLSNHSDHSVPFLEHLPDSDLGHTDAYSEKLSDERPLIGSRRRLRPGVFFAVLQTRGFIPLPYSTAVWVMNYGHLVTVIFTQISTGLSLFSSFLFSWGVRQSIALHMHGEGMSLAAFISTIRISSRSLILDAKKRRWSAMSIVVFILTVMQTSCWSGLITPLPLDVDFPMTGRELDLSSPKLQSLQDSRAPRLLRANLAVFFVGQTESGYATLKNYLGLAASLSLFDVTFNVSTAGIFPLTPTDVDARGRWFVGTPATYVPKSLWPIQDLPEGLLSPTYSMMQQGFTADVSCEYRELNANTTPSLFFLSDETNEWRSGSTTPLINFSEMNSDCVVPVGSGLNDTTVYTTGDPNIVLMIACGGVSAEPYKVALIFQGFGMYQFLNTTVCTFNPKITRVQVDYADTGINSTQFTESAIADAGPAGLSAVTTIYEMVLFAQAMFTNVVGDEVNSLVVDPEAQDDFLRAMEEYIRGVAEYSASVFRACLTVKNGTFVDGVPADMRILSEGVLQGKIVGWKRITASTFYVMIPGTIVAIVTIYIMLVTLVNHAGDPEGDPFDPADPMHLVSVSAAGGLTNVFTGTEETDIRAAESVKVVLHTIEGGAPVMQISRRRIMCSLEIQPPLDLSRLQGSARRAAGKVGTPIVGRRAVGAHARLIRAGKRALPAFVRDERSAHPHLLLKGPPTMCTASRSYPRPPMWVVVLSEDGAHMTMSLKARTVGCLSENVKPRPGTV
ncbi:hypothetical protein B0H14DRAFT_2576958 [Mycena olivaceomarginata]|nr:hypothetical protein B0H14DRAFT_2576958 [Mycena olivaceomarginata]